MPKFVALLRAINVGGTSVLAMKELLAMCIELGFQNVRTYIQSGNVVFETRLSEEKVRAALEETLARRMGKKVDVMVRSASELRSILEANPFPEAPQAKVIVMFLPRPAPKGVLDDVAGPDGEEVRSGHREIYIYYPNGMGRSKLKLPSALGLSTARNMNTVAKLVAMLSP